MKTWKVYLAIVALSFVVGLGLVATYAPAVTASDGPPLLPNCDHTCQHMIYGGQGDCPDPDMVEAYLCGRTPFCEHPDAEACDCIFAGCVYYIP